MNELTAHRVAAAVVAVPALAVLVHWMATQPAPVDHRPELLPMYVELLYSVAQRAPRGGAAAWWIAAFTGAIACGLSLVLTVKARASAASPYLAFALAASGAAMTYYMFALPFPLAGWQAARASPAALFVADLGANLLWVTGLWYLMRFFRYFPRPIELAEWRRHRLAIAEEQRAKGAVHGWLQSHDRSHDEARSGRLFRVLDSWKSAGELVAVGSFAAALQYALRLQLFESGSGAERLAVMFSWGFFLITAAWAATAAYAFLDFHRHRGSDEERRRIGWIYATVFVGWALLTVFILATLATVVLLVRLAPGVVSRELLEPLFILIPIYVGPVLFVLACVASLALSVFYRGMVDPRLAAQRVTVWGVLSIIVTVVFVLIERALALKITHWLAMPDEWGPVVAGALVAATVAPLRGWVEKATNNLVARFLPVDMIAGGARRETVIALSDLSGYTALSGRDEKQALLVAALLAQRALRAASAHGGRVVKGMGDAVILEFEDARRACAALLELHEGFPAAADAVGVPALPLHSSAHWGEVTVAHDGDVYGQTVNVASRLLGVAKEGQIVVSERLSNAAALPPERLQDLGARELKNVPQPVTCYLLLTPAPGAAPVPAFAQREAIER